VLPDRSILKGQKLVENDKIEKLKFKRLKIQKIIFEFFNFCPIKTHLSGNTV